MIGHVLAERLQSYGPRDAVEQELVLMELVQHFVLVGLADARFFQHAAFHGGTCLRIIHGLDRFSEDLDFVSREPLPSFQWAPYLEALVSYFADLGIPCRITDRTTTGPAVQKALCKVHDLQSELTLSLPFSRDDRRVITVKLEVDTCPPSGSTFMTSYLDFPRLSAITTQDLPSSFAGKLHALLCRSYVKGRDWYDLLWYLSRAIAPNTRLIEAALRQRGPWEGTPVVVTKQWLVDQLLDTIHTIDWARTTADVRRFVSPASRPTLDLWSADLFESRVTHWAQRVQWHPEI